ncbi:hypothetical protein [Tatumella ptyseos]|nr:hypothetical protein [Tatumella ptyseos]WKX26950.1 hypothetical protein QJR74_02000 [Tatumella ptyseos]
MNKLLTLLDHYFSQDYDEAWSHWQNTTPYLLTCCLGLDSL